MTYLRPQLTFWKNLYLYKAGEAKHANKVKAVQEQVEMIVFLIPMTGT